MLLSNLVDILCKGYCIEFTDIPLSTCSGFTKNVHTLHILLGIFFLKLETIHYCFLCPYKRQSSKLCFIAFRFSLVTEVTMKVKRAIGLHYTNYVDITNTCACVECPHYLE